MGLVIVVTVQDGIVNQLYLLFPIYLPPFNSLLLLFSVFSFPHWRRIWSLLFSHIVIHQSISKPIVRLFCESLEIFLWTPLIKWITYRLVNKLFFFGRSVAGWSLKSVLFFLIRGRVDRVRLHLYVFLDFLCIIFTTLLLVAKIVPFTLYFLL